MFDSFMWSDAVKFAAGLALLGIWWIYYRLSISPYLAAKKAGSAAVFPMFALLAMIGLTGGYFYYLGIEPALRRPIQGKAQVPTDANPALQKRATKKAPEFVPVPSIDEKSARMIETNRLENAAAKKSFSELPPVKSNGNGGAEAK